MRHPSPLGQPAALHHCRSLAVLILSLGILSFPDAPTSAQEAASGVGAVRSTTVNVELLSRSEGGAVHAQEWGRVFEKLEVSLVIRRGLPGDMPELKETVRGTLRTVTLIGRLERNGDISFPGKTIRRSDTPALQEWMNELKTYGAQGAPVGKPLWGLSKPQFEALFAALATPTKADVVDKTLPVAIEALELPAAYPLRWSSRAEQQFRNLVADNTARQSITGFTTATALAVILNDRGFGFRPNRAPDGTIELVVEPLTDEPPNHWPIGWPTQKQVPELLPGMFAFANIAFRDWTLAELVRHSSEATKDPVVVDYAALNRDEPDWMNLRFRHTFRKTTWSLALRYALVPEKLNREYFQDEAGRGFVLITTIGKPRRPESP